MDNSLQNSLKVSDLFSVSNTTNATEESLFSEGEKAFEKMTPEEKAAIGSLSDGIEFIHLLGNPFDMHKRRVALDEQEKKQRGYEQASPAERRKLAKQIPCSRPIAAKFLIHKEMLVPSIPAIYKPETGVPPEAIKWIKVYPGQEIILTKLEMFFLSIDPKINKRVMYKGAKDVCTIHLKLTAFDNLESKMGVYGRRTPVPYISVQGCAPKQYTQDICAKGEDGRPIWEDSAAGREYKERFSCLFEEKEKVQKAVNKSSIDKKNTTLVLGLNQNFSEFLPK